MPWQGKAGSEIEKGISRQGEKEMCLAIPMLVKNVRGDEAEVESNGATYTASIRLTPQVKVGDFVLLHTGYAISIVDKEEAEQTIALFQQIESLIKDER
jgi:hydrogenase expression/formation protein HypC